LNVNGLDLTGIDFDSTRTPGSVRARVRVHPFPAATRTMPDADSAYIWALGERKRLREVHAHLKAAGRLPPAQLTLTAAKDLGLLELIFPTAEGKPIGRASPGDAVRLFEVLDSYLANEARGHATNYTSRARWLKTFFGDVPLSQITQPALEDYKAERASGRLGRGRSKTPAYASKAAADQANRKRRNAGIPVVAKTPPASPERPSSQSIRHEIQLLRQALKAWVQRGDEARRLTYTPYVNAHPIMTVALPAKAAARDRRISEQENQRILARMHNPLTRLAIEVTRLSTLRRAEVLSLRKEDFHLDEGFVLLRAPARAAAGATKSKTRTRQVPLVAELVEQLRGVDLSGAGALFPIKPGSMTQAFGRAAERAGVRDVRLHDERREGVSHLLDLGLSETEVTVFTGHLETRTLREHYARPDGGKLARKVDQLRGNAPRAATLASGC
jgi:integrase